MGVFTRGVPAHSYMPGGPQRVQSDGHAIVHQNPRHGTTPLSRPVAAWSAGGAPYYNSGYVYPVYGPIRTGGSPVLRLPAEAGQLDLTDMTTWDRPVYFTGVR
jgi:hypothetical protein